MTTTTTTARGPGRPRRFDMPNPTALRLSRDVLDRADALVGPFGDKRADVMREAMVRGLAAFEAADEDEMPGWTPPRDPIAENRRRAAARKLAQDALERRAAGFEGVCRVLGMPASSPIEDVVAAVKDLRAALYDATAKP